MEDTTATRGDDELGPMSGERRYEAQHAYFLINAECDIIASATSRVLRKPDEPV